MSGCACRILTHILERESHNFHTIEYCPLHASAERLRDALQAIVDDWDGIPEARNTVMGHIMVSERLPVAKAALAACKVMVSKERTVIEMGPDGLATFTPEVEEP